MNKEELAIAKRIAKIEGIEPWWDNSDGDTKHYITDSAGGVGIYNPFGWPVLGPLMVKHEVSPSYANGVYLCEMWTGGVRYATSCLGKQEIPRAILECIIKSQEA